MRWIGMVLRVLLCCDGGWVVVSIQGRNCIQIIMFIQTFKEHMTGNRKTEKRKSEL